MKYYEFVPGVTPIFEGEQSMNIIELAREAASGMLSYDAEGNWRLGEKEVERFAELVRNAVLEEAAGVCEQIDTAAFGGERPRPNDCAAAIRAMKEQV